jgi:di/tricarboxylate transporter
VLGATRVLSSNAVRDINWNFMLLLGVLMGMADVFSANGLDRWLGSLASGALGAATSTPLVFVLGLAVLCMALSFVLRLQAAIGVLIVTLAPAAQVRGIDPWIVALVVLVAYNTFFFSYQNTMYLALQNGTAGRLFRHAQTRPLAVAYPVLALVALAASVPWWHALHLL